MWCTTQAAGTAELPCGTQQRKAVPLPDGVPYLNEKGISVLAQALQITVHYQRTGADVFGQYLGALRVATRAEGAEAVRQRPVHAWKPTEWMQHWSECPQQHSRL